MKPKLVALDIDGTIVHQPGSLPWVTASGDGPSPETALTIEALQDAGIAVVLASGRMFPGVARLHASLGLRTPLICQQGCSVHSATGETLHEFPLDRSTALEIADYAREVDLPYEWFTPLRYLVSRQTEDSDVYAGLSGVPVEYVDAPEMSGLDPTGVGIISTRERAPEIHRELVRNHGHRAHVLDFPTVTVSVAEDANKGHALDLLCADLGIERHETVAIGDSVNDASMLAWAGRGYAVSHADQYAMDACDDVLDCTESDGVTALLRSWLD